MNKQSIFTCKSNILNGRREASKIVLATSSFIGEYPIRLALKGQFHSKDDKIYHCWPKVFIKAPPNTTI